MIPTPDDIERAWERIRDHVRVTPVLSLEAGELGLPGTHRAQAGAAAAHRIVQAAWRVQFRAHAGWSRLQRRMSRFGTARLQRPRRPHQRDHRRVGRQPRSRRRLRGATARPARRGLRAVDQPADEARPHRRPRCRRPGHRGPLRRRPAWLQTRGRWRRAPSRSTPTTRRSSSPARARCPVSWSAKSTPSTPCSSPPAVAGSSPARRHGSPGGHASSASSRRPASACAPRWRRRRPRPSRSAGSPPTRSARHRLGAAPWDVVHRYVHDAVVVRGRGHPRSAAGDLGRPAPRRRARRGCGAGRPADRRPTDPSRASGSSWWCVAPTATPRLSSDRASTLQADGVPGPVLHGEDGTGHPVVADPARGRRAESPRRCSGCPSSRPSRSASACTWCRSRWRCRGHPRCRRSIRSPSASRGGTS